MELVDMLDLESNALSVRVRVSLSSVPLKFNRQNIGFVVRRYRFNSYKGHLSFEFHLK